MKLIFNVCLYIKKRIKKKTNKKRKTAFQVKSDYSNIINESTSKTVNRKSVRVNHRKSNKSVNFPPKKSSIKTLELKSSVNDNKEEKEPPKFILEIKTEEKKEESEVFIPKDKNDELKYWDTSIDILKQRINQVHNEEHKKE